MSAFGKAPKNSPRQAQGRPGSGFSGSTTITFPVHLEVVPDEALPLADGAGERLGFGGLACCGQDNGQTDDGQELHGIASLGASSIGAVP